MWGILVLDDDLQSLSTLPSRLRFTGPSYLTQVGSAALDLGWCAVYP